MKNVVIVKDNGKTRYIPLSLVLGLLLSIVHLIIYIRPLISSQMVLDMFDDMRFNIRKLSDLFLIPDGEK